MSTARELKPCPFCLIDGDGYLGVATLRQHFCVQCSVCEASGPWKLSEEEAESAWNDRGAGSLAQPGEGALTEAIHRLAHCWEHMRWCKETSDAIEAVITAAGITSTQTGDSNG